MMLNLIMVSPFLSGLANHLWQTTVFVGVVALVVFAMRGNHARGSVTRCGSSRQ
jgi:hypothetical protein